MKRRWLCFLVSCVGMMMMSACSLVIFAATQQSLQVTSEDLFLVPVPVHHAFEIVQVLHIKNSSTTRQDVQVDLPTGFQNLQVQNIPKNLQRIQGDTLRLVGVANGKSSVITLSYVLSLSGGQGEQMSLHTIYPVYAAHIYLPIGDAAISATGLLTTTQTTTISGTNFRVFSRLGIPAGDDWTISLQMLPSVTPNQKVAGLHVIGGDANGAGNDIQALGNLFLAAFIFVVGIVSIRTATSASGQGFRMSPTEALYQAWERTEKDYQAGLIHEEAYSARCQDFKNRIITLSHSSKNGGPPSE